MQCIICNSNDVRHYFTTTFTGDYSKFLDKSEYHQCKNCGFVFSKTLFEMDYARWCKLNIDVHSYFEETHKNMLYKNMDTIANQPPYLSQASMINMLIKNGIIESTNTGGGGANPIESNLDSINSFNKCNLIKADMIDYAGGIGSLARILNDYYQVLLMVYEKYMDTFLQDGKVHYIKEEHLGKHKVVINSAMFEHITKREYLEHINSLVADDGMLIIHTLVRQNIPRNPKWFYINPVHCSLFTNDAMQTLMDQWGYTQSLYSPIAKSWVWFKKDNKHCKNGDLLDFANKINNELQMKYFYHKHGFMDYWVD